MQRLSVTNTRGGGGVTGDGNLDDADDDERLREWFLGDMLSIDFYYIFLFLICIC